jgi:flagellar motor switch/type III secretory pathway protein FliN
MLLFHFWSRYCLLSLHMAAAHPLSPPASEPAQGLRSPPEDTAAIEQSLIPLARALTADGIVLTAAVARLPVELDVSVPVRNFRVRNLLALEPSQLIESGWGHGEDLPLAAGDVQLAWSEFEVINTQLSVRVTRLA